MIYIDPTHRKIIHKLKDLDDIKLVKPENAGKYWQGVKHADLAKAVTNSILDMRWCIKEKNFYVDNSGFNFAGSWTFVAKRSSRPNEYFSFGLTTSNQRKQSTQFYVGISTADDSEMFLPDKLGIVFYKLDNMKHTTKQNLEDEIDNRMNATRLLLHEVFSTSQKFYNCDITERTETILLVASTKTRLTRWGDIKDIYHTIQSQVKPSVTAHQLCCLFAYQIRNINPILQLHNLYRFRKIVHVDVP
jgi:hypothetical protein